MAWCHSFCLFFIFYNIHTYIHTITFIQYISPSPFAEAFLHFFIASMLSGKHLPVVPSQESNSGLPYSKPTRYQLSHAAPLLSHAAPCWATPHHTEPRRTILSHAAPYWGTPHHNWATPHHSVKCHQQYRAAGMVWLFMYLYTNLSSTGMGMRGSISFPPEQREKGCINVL